MEDGAKKRRGYLVATAKIQSVSEASRIAIVMFTIGTVFMVFIDCTIPRPCEYPPIWLVLTLSLGSAILAISAYQVMKRADARARALPYVPQVAEQIAALPADEILLRGADRPAGASGELLRAVKAGRELVSEELLRVADGTE